MKRQRKLAHIARISLCAGILLAIANIGPSVAAAKSGGVGATVTHVEGDVEIIPPNQTRALPARGNMRVEPGGTIRTRANGRVELQFDDRSLLRLDHNSEIQILAGAKERGIMVTLGNIWTKVQTVLGMSKFQVRTPTVVAGVRGTIVRAEVTQDESTIAVDEGEVEITTGNGDAPVILGQSQMVRRRRGGAHGVRPVRFNPEGRQKWEFWTDPLVQQRLKGIEEAATQAQAQCAEAEQRARDVFGALAVDGEASLRLLKRVTTANLLVASVRQSLAPGTPAARPGPRGGGPRSAQKRLTKPEMIARLNQADAIYAECLPLIGRGREALTQHVADLEGLRESMAAHQQTMQAVQQNLTVFRHRREKDPHWHSFKPGCERSEGYRGQIAKALQQCRPLLKKGADQKLGDDPKKLLTIEHRFAWAFRTLEGLEARVSQGKQQIAQLRGTLGVAGQNRPPGPGPGAAPLRPGAADAGGGPGPRPGRGETTKDTPQ